VDIGLKDDMVNSKPGGGMETNSGKEAGKWRWNREINLNGACIDVAEGGDFGRGTS